MTTRKAHELVLTAVADLEAAAKADGYEMGARAGRIASEKATVLALDVVGRPTMMQLLDRLQLFRQMIATHDTRYSMLGEIIADFAAALEAPGAPTEGSNIDGKFYAESEVQAGEIKTDDYVCVGGKWCMVITHGARIGSRVWMSLAGHERVFEFGVYEPLLIRRIKPGTPAGAPA